MAAAMFLLASVGCQGRGSRPRQIILISVDTLRQDALGCYGNPDVSTPNIDALARNGVLFRQAFTHAPSTLPSHASMLFSRHPWNLGVFHNGDKVPQRPDSLPQLLKARGYATAAFVSLAALDSSHGLAQGFDHYADDVARKPGRPYLFADEVNEQVLAWLSGHQQQAFFLFIHYSDPHEPYVPKDAPPDMELALDAKPLGTFGFAKRELETVRVQLKPGRSSLTFRSLPEAGGANVVEYAVRQLRLADPALRITPPAGLASAGDLRTFTGSASYVIENPTGELVGTDLMFRGRATLGKRRMRQQYLREVEWVDKAIGELVAWLSARGLYEASLIALVADHGEGLGDHGSLGHESQLYLSQLRVPFILMDRRHPHGEVSTPVTLLDVAPTLLSRLGVPRPAGWEGRDLNDLLDGNRGARAQREVHSATFFGADPSALTHRKFSVLRPPQHLIFTLPGERYELYDISADPEEKLNLLKSAERPEGHDELVASARRLAAQAEAGLQRRAEPALSPEQTEQLQALGYLGGADPE